MTTSSITAVRRSTIRSKPMLRVPLAIQVKYRSMWGSSGAAPKIPSPMRTLSTQRNDSRTEPIAISVDDRLAEAPSEKAVERGAKQGRTSV